MLRFKEREDIIRYNELNEKQIIIGGGANYGQIVFLVGGGASGKGFARDNFMQGNKFKVRDVDEWKNSFRKIGKIKNKYPELQNLDLSKPGDVFKMHMFVQDLGIKEKTLSNMLKDIMKNRSSTKGTLPNIIFDITLKNYGSLSDVVPLLKEVGYLPKNIHIVWVLTNYYVAVQNNRSRERIVPEDVLLKTHESTATSMYEIIKKGTPNGVDGSLYVILNNKEHTVFHVNNKGEKLDGKIDKETGKQIRPLLIKDFKYIQLKKPGKPISNERYMKDSVFQWIKDNVPVTALKTVGLK